MTDHVPTEQFARAYQGKPPWDIDRPQSAFVNASELIEGSILDVGCGTGEHVIFFANRGHPITGVDALDVPVELAREKVRRWRQDLPAAGQVGSIRLRTQDALKLSELEQKFDSVIDCGLFHVFSDQNRARYVDQLKTVTRPGGRVFLHCFSDREPAGDGPRRVSRPELVAAFADGWTVISIDPARYEVRTDHPDLNFSLGGAHAWFCVFQRNA